jgi:hypothetical protein
LKNVANGKDWSSKLEKREPGKERQEISFVGGEGKQ